MSLPVLQLTVIGAGESLLRMEKRLRCAATALGLTLQLEIDKHSENYVLAYSETPAVRVGTRWLARGLLGTEALTERLRAHLALQGEPR